LDSSSFPVTAITASTGTSSIAFPTRSILSSEISRLCAVSRLIISLFCYLEQLTYRMTGLAAIIALAPETAGYSCFGTVPCLYVQYDTGSRRGWNRHTE
jgi:hypothetical protein